MDARVHAHGWPVEGQFVTWPNSALTPEPTGVEQPCPVNLSTVPRTDADGPSDALPPVPTGVERP